MEISVVATLYRSAPYIAEFHRRITEAASKLTSAYEIILVNDGSPDNSLELALELSKKDTHVVVVDLSRNFGHHNAMITGLQHATGERIFLIDTDLEEEPEWLLTFSEQMTAGGYDMVYGVQTERKGGWFERVSGHYFYSFFRALTGVDVPRNFVTARLMTRRYLNAMLSYQEREIFLGGIMHITGFSQHATTVFKHSHSETTYTMRRKLYLMTNSITSFTNTPLIAIFCVGVCVLLGASVFTSYLIFRWLFLAKPLMGWTSILASIWLLGGLTISFIGIVGIYLAKVFSEVKRRPYAIVRAVYGR